MSDKATEMKRYDERAKEALASSSVSPPPLGVDAVSPLHRAPYRWYQACINECISSDHRVLELGAGSGVFTSLLLDTGAHIVASDISPSALELLSRSLNAKLNGRLETRVADMELLPFDDESFDVVVSAGSLSYGDPETVDAQVRRVLRRGGAFICVDSLNHNPIYRLNRRLQYQRGSRTRSTLTRMPSLRRIAAITAAFDLHEVRFFGSLTWAMPLVARILGTERAAEMSDRLDGVIGVRRSAFKFVLVARGRR